MKNNRIFSNVKNFKETFSSRIVETYGRSVEESHRFEKYYVLGTMIRDLASVAWKETKERVQKNQQREMVYFSMEFLLGKMMLNNIKNLGLYDIIKDGLNEYISNHYIKKTYDTTHSKKIRIQIFTLHQYR